MRGNFYVIRMESHRWVAAEVNDRQAAEALEAGRPLLLAGPAELARLAQRQGKSLAVFATGSTGKRRGAGDGDGPAGTRAVATPVRVA